MATREGLARPRAGDCPARRPVGLSILRGWLPWVGLAFLFQGSAALAQREPPQAAAEVLPQDVRLGLELAMTLTQGIGVVDTTEWNERLSAIGYRIAAVSGDSDTPYSFDVLDLDEPNAMALPGGFIFVTRGMMEAGLTDTEMAHLLGHEIAHVRQRHFDRASRMSSILSLARTALMVGIMMGVHDSQPASQRIATSDDPGLHDWTVGMSGKDALLQGSSVFGGVLQALFERGYSRGLEFEADAWGARLAAQAGFDPEGGPRLLEHLRERSYETHRYSYWRTHPYFTERLPRAERQAEKLAAVDPPPPDREYREQAAIFFAGGAEQVRDEEQALFLFQRALRCEPENMGSLANALQLARFKGRRERREHALFRRYGALIASYERIIAQGQEGDPGWAELTEAIAERDSLVAERDGLLSSQLEVIGREAPPTDLLERFVENYPDHPRAGEITYRLGMQYFLGGRPAKAVELLSQLRAETADSVWADSAEAGMLQAIPELDELAACYGVLEAHAHDADAPSERIAAAARARMDQLAAADFSLEQGGAFLTSWPETPWSAAVRQRVEQKAQEAYLNGRVHEGLHRYQEALDSYYSILTLAPDSPAAALAGDAVDRIQELAEEP